MNLDTLKNSIREAIRLYNEGSDNSEYLRGQIELAMYLLGYEGDGTDLRVELESYATETLPCQTCGTPVPADIHAEELGFCQPCQADYFDHSDEEDETQKELDAFWDTPTREDNN
jgi:hypothetical protein